jgi:hypothetical protein
VYISSALDVLYLGLNDILFNQTIGQKYTDYFIGFRDASLVNSNCILAQSKLIFKCKGCLVN